MQNIWKTMHARGFRQIKKLSSYYLAGRKHIKLPRQIKICIENLSRSYPEISMDRESVENVSSKQRAQKFGSMDRPRCQEAIEVKSKNLDRRNLCQAAVEMLLRNCQKDRSKIFQGKKNTQDECNKITTQTSI